MPPRNRWGLPISLHKVRLKSGDTSWRAGMDVPPRLEADGSTRRVRIKAQAPNASQAVARLVLRLTDRGYLEHAERLREAAVVSLGAGFTDLLESNRISKLPLLGAAATAHIEARAREGAINEQTAERYRGLAKNHILVHPIARKHLDEITPEDLEAYFQQLADKQNEDGTQQLGATPRRSIHGVLSQVFAAAVADEKLLRSPLTVGRAKKPRKGTGAVFAERHGAADFMTSLMRAVPYEVYLRQFPLFFGLRTSERLALQHSSFAVERRGFPDVLRIPTVEMRVVQQLDRTAARNVLPLKTDESPRTLPLPRIALPHLDALYLRRAIQIVEAAEKRGDKKFLKTLLNFAESKSQPTFSSHGSLVSPVFTQDTFLITSASGQPYRQQKANELWRDVCATYAPNEHIREHDFRHVATSFLTERQFPEAVVASVTGHSLKARSTMVATYNHPSADQREDAMDWLACLYARPAEPPTRALPETLNAYVEKKPLWSLWRTPYQSDFAYESKQGEQLSVLEQNIRGLLQRWQPPRLRTVELPQMSDPDYPMVALYDLSGNLPRLRLARGFAF